MLANTISIVNKRYFAIRGIDRPDAGNISVWIQPILKIIENFTSRRKKKVMETNIEIDNCIFSWSQREGNWRERIDLTPDPDGK